MFLVLENEIKRLTESISDAEKTKNPMIKSYILNIEKILLRLKARAKLLKGEK